MKPKEKAEELFDKYYNLPVVFDCAKECAIIAVDEILGLDCGDSLNVDYWNKIKQEIKKL